MKYKIEKGDKFLCLKDYIMDNESIAYTEGKIYLSALDHNITDNEFDSNHAMDSQDDFFEFFKLIR